MANSGIGSVAVSQRGKTHLAGVDLLAAEGVVVGTHLDGWALMRKTVGWRFKCCWEIEMRGFAGVTRC